ncbi:MAG: DUF4115 domain-containing protein [Gammaproteobacteria bacterium]|nr:DUF4115 domain-containing protein [Gammaproteobacteria bacterium]
MTQLNDDTEQQQEDVAESALPTSGELLKAAREAAGMTVLQVADRLRLRQQLIHELEADKLDGSTSTYVRGYLRAYAKLVQIPEADIMEAYKRTRGAEEPELSTMQSFSRKTSIESQDNRLMLITWVIVLLLIASVAVFVWQQFVEDKNGNGQSAVTPAQTQQTATMVTANPDAESYNSADSEWRQDVSGGDLRGEVDEGMAASSLTSNEQNADGVSDSSMSDSSVSEDVAVSAPERENEAVVTTNTTPTTSATQQTQQPTTRESTPQSSSPAERTAATNTAESSLDSVIRDNELVLVFRGDSWVRIEDADGEAIAFGVKVTDHVMPLNSTAPYQLTLGAPSVVDVYFQGQKVDLSQFSGGRVARFQLPAE